MTNKYPSMDDIGTMASEPTLAYGSKAAEGIARKAASYPPCTFTDEEFAEELRLSEASGNATDKEVNEMFARWIS